MKKARSMLLNEEFTSDDNRLTYQSYEKLALICNVCGELVFFKQGIERVSHFSHYKDTGKNKCRWRTKSHDSTQNTDSEAKKQSLEKFQKKIQDIIDEGIIKYQKISCSQLDDARHRKILLDRIDQGKSLVNQYKIDINLWLSRFYKEREHIQKFALSSYHNKSSEIQRLVFSNIVHYLCLPASENILGNILYYVFYLLNKEVALNNDFEEVRSKVIEIISFADWEKEYKRAKELVDTSNFEQNAHSDFVNSPVEVKGFVDPNIKPKTSIINDDGSIAISKEVKTLLTSKAQLTNLSNAKSVAKNSLEWCGMLANVPCRVKLVNSKDHWQLEALPIKDVPTFPLLYCLANKAIEGYWQEEDLDNLIIEPLDKEMARLDELAAKTQDPLRVEKFGRKETNLQRLRKSVLNRQKLDPKVLAECTDIVKEAISKADYRPSITDPYFSRYILGQVYFVSKVEDSITYLLDDYMSHKRVSTQVMSVIRWLNLLLNNLKTQFPKNKPTVKELKDYLYPKFNSKFNSEYKGLGLDIREEGKKILLDIIHNDKVQVTQLLTAKMPATEGKNRGKVSVKVNGTPNFSERRVFEKFLKTKDGRFVAEAQNQLRHLVNVFLSRNFNTLVGEGKVGHQRKVSEIIGFERSTKGWSEIKNGFIKHLTPFSSNSEVNKGKLIYLNTLQPLSINDLEGLVIKIAENWSNWTRKNQEYIKIGNSSGKAVDPQSLVWVLTQKILTGNFEDDKDAWQDTINWFAEICKSSNEYRAIGFRCENGVILTPDVIYSTHPDKWLHRIKIQLIAIIKEADKTRTLGIESLLQRDIYSLYSLLDRLQPGLNNKEDIHKHLQALHDTLAAEGDNEAIPEIPDTVEETQNHLESSSEVLEVNPEITQPPEIQQPKPIALDAAKTITGSKLITKGVIVTTPMVITLEDESDKWKISGLPVKTPPYDLAVYLSDKLGIKDLIIHIDTTLSSLSLESEEHKLLSLLKSDLLTGYKISKEQILSSTKVVQGCLDRAIPTHKALYLDNYYCPHVLGYVEFLEDKEKEFLTYALTIWGSERDTRRSEVPTIMDWLKRIPINLRKEFKSSYPSIEQIENYLHSKFNFSNC